MTALPVIAAALAASVPLADASSLPSALPDLGGLTYDFHACSERLQAELSPTTSNMVDEAISTGCVRWVSSSATGDVVRHVELPNSAGGRYRFSCSYRRACASGSWGGCLVQFMLGGKVKPGLAKMRMLCDGAGWQRCAEYLDVPVGIDRLRLIFRLRGPGELAFRDVGLRPVRRRCEFPISLVATPTGVLDGRFAVSKGQCGMLVFACSSDSPCAALWNGARYALRLPKGYVCLDTTFGSVEKSEDQPDGGLLVCGAVDPDRCPAPVKTPSTMGVLIAAAEDAACEGVCTLTVESAGKPVSEAASVVLYVVPPVRAAGVPKRYRNGLNAGVGFRFRDARALDALGRLLGDAGAGWLVAEAGSGARLLPFWRRYGHGPYTPYSMPLLKDGFRVGPEAGRPAEDRYVAHDPDGADASHVRRATCPVAVYEERPFFLGKAVPALASMARGADGIWANWEPYRFEGRGCFCASCKKAFSAFSGIPPDEVEKEWPKALMRGGKWEDQAHAFRSREHARLVLTVDRYVRAMTGGDSSVGFIPGVAWPEMSSEWRRLGMGREVQEIDYAGGLRWVCPWGPYPYWKMSSPYGYSRTMALLPWCAARDLRGAVDRDYPAGARPKLMGFPQGLQGGDWVTQPECLSMALDAYFFNRWAAAVVYYFPQGYDARYWRAFAEATERAAEFEDFVLDGRRVDGKCSAVPVPEYAVPAKSVTKYLAACRDQPLLQTAAFEKNGSRIVAVLNHWMRGEAYFDLRIGGMPDGEYAISGGGLLWTKDADRQTWSSSELASGVRLMVGAVRTVVFRVSPARAGAVSAAQGVVTRRELDGLYASRRSALRRLADDDAAEEEHSGMPVLGNSSAATCKSKIKEARL